MKKICFAIPVHEKKDVIINQLENIRFFCPQAHVVLFRSGNDPTLCDGLDVPVCPYSFPMEWGKDFAWFFLYVMEWLENIGYEYDYLINLDSDSLFIKKGFEQFIVSQMNDADYMAAHFEKAHKHWAPGRTMKKVWHLWEPIFNSSQLYKCFGSQVFSREFIKKILMFDKLQEMKWVMKQTEEDVFALEEMLFSTLAHSLGLKSKRFPKSVNRWMRYLPKLKPQEIREAIKDKDCFLVHPINRSLRDPSRKLIIKLQTDSTTAIKKRVNITSKRKSDGTRKTKKRTKSRQRNKTLHLKSKKKKK